MNDMTIDELEIEVERVLMGIACSVWETDWTKDMREYHARLEEELGRRYHAELEPEEIAFQIAEEESQ